MTSPAKPRRRCRAGSAPAKSLGDQVTVKVEITGRIVARTLDDQSHVDIVTPDGQVWRNIPIAWIAEDAEVVRLPTVVSVAA